MATRQPAGTIARGAGTSLDGLARVRAFLVVVVIGCNGPSSTPDGNVAPQCGGVVPSFATVDGGTVTARCGEREVSATPLADGVIKLRYATRGTALERSWAVIDPPALDETATFGGDGDRAIACTSEITVAIDDACRVHATLADGTVIADDLELALGDRARLVRAARADRVYGLGERTGGLDKRGRAWTFWNTDAYDPAHGGWAPDQDPLYQSIPFAVHVGGGVAHGVFTDQPRRMVFDYTDPARDVIDADARSLEQYLIAGPRMADVVDRYTRLTGRPALPPRWALGFHQSRWGYPDGATLEAVAQRFRTDGIPAEALWLDIQHLRGFRTFTIDDAFPQASLDRVRALGFKLIAIADPGIKVEPGWDVYDSGVAGGHFLRDARGEFHGTAWPGISVFPDFSRAATRAWWGEHVTSLTARGIAGIWLDVNEPTTFPEGGGGNTVPGELIVDNDGDHTTMAAFHNAYALHESQATFEALAATGKRPFVLSRAGYAGIQRHAAVWTGDTPSTWDGLAQTLPMLLGLGVSGVPIVGSDIGGYSGNASVELYARWMALGSISPFARAHVTDGVRGQEPWMFGDEVTELSRDLLVERDRLLPYLYSLADEAARTGAPILRPLVWEFPEDPAVGNLGDQAMLGPSILVAPIVELGATSREVYLPAGRWFEYHSGAIFDGPSTITVSTTLAALPMFVREGAIIPSASGVIDVYPGAPSSFTLYEDDGESQVGGTRTRIELAAEADGARLSLHRDSATPLIVRVHRVDGAVTGVDGASSFTHDLDARVLEARVTDAAELRFHYEPTITELRPPVAVTFEVRVPADTPQATPIHIASSATSWTHVPLAWIAPGLARGTITVPRGEWFDYKVTRGSFDTVEKLAGCGEAPNRYRFGAAGTRQITVATWRDRCD